MDPKDLAAHNLEDMKATRIILDAVKDHLILTYLRRSQLGNVGGSDNVRSNSQPQLEDGVEG